MISEILEWNKVSRTQWEYNTQEKDISYFVFELTKLPDFSDIRFSYLSSNLEARGTAVVDKQKQMLRSFHTLGSNWGISLRLLKEDGIKLYLVFRLAGNEPLSKEEKQANLERISNLLLNQEYSFTNITETESAIKAFDLSWANEVSDINKKEEIYYGDYYTDGTRQQFYVPFQWNQTNNSMEYICKALMSHNGRACIDVTIVPTKYIDDEKRWLSENTFRISESMNGETIRSEKDNKILWQGRHLPELRVPHDCCEKMNKQYDISKLFLSSIHVFAESNSDFLANELITNSVSNSGSVQIFRKGYNSYSYFEACHLNVDISANSHTKYWNENRDNAPFRAQRLLRITSLEEISNFFRIPVPNHPGFPGFSLDIGLGNQKKDGNKKKSSIITLGNYLDDNSGNDTRASFDNQQLVKHGLIVGVPGSGKTTAMFNILDQLWNVPDNQKIPFIVLEPAKTEYRALMNLPEFKDDMLVFSLGDESVSPFRFNPMEVLPGASLETHISLLLASFIGAFDLFDPLPLFLEQAIRKTYEEKGWYNDSLGGEKGCETPTLSDLCVNAKKIIENSGFDKKMVSDFTASLLERLNSLRRGSKGRMLDTKYSVPIEDLMEKPVILELDSLNGDEKTLLMMFLLTYIFEYCKIKRKSGSPLKHMLLVEEAHNLIAPVNSNSNNHASARAKTIELFVNMLAEMRALGQGILIADQLPTAIASQAVKQTNVKIMMRVTSKDDREEMGNTMDLNEEQLHQVVKFKTGHAYVYHEGEDSVRFLRMLNFKDDHDISEPPSNQELHEMMASYEDNNRELYMPFKECSQYCSKCNKRVRNQAELFVSKMLLENDSDPYKIFQNDEYKKTVTLCGVCGLKVINEAERLIERYGTLSEEFGACVYIHMMNHAVDLFTNCSSEFKNKCNCSYETKLEKISKYDKLVKDVLYNEN